MPKGRPSTLTKEDKRRIWRYSQSGLTHQHIADKMHISKSYVGVIVTQMNKELLQLAEEGPRERARQITEEEAKKITFDKITEDERYVRLQMLEVARAAALKTQRQLEELTLSHVTTVNATAIKNLSEAFNKQFDSQSKLYSQLRALEMETADDIEVGWDWIVREEEGEEDVSS